MPGASIIRTRTAAATQFLDRFQALRIADTETISCPICDGEQFTSILPFSDVTNDDGPIIGLERCTDCSLTVTSLRSAIETAPSSYREAQWFTDRINTNQDRWRWLEHFALRTHFGYLPQPVSPMAKILSNLAMWKFHSRLKRHDWIPFRAPGRLLDIGCSMPTFQRRMQSFGWTVTGIELAHEFIATLDLEPKANDWTQRRLSLEPESFDAITMWHVLQRNSNPRQLVRDAARLLRPGGLMVIEVPNIESLTFAEFKEHWFGLELPVHLQHFNPKSMNRVFQETDLRIIEVQQIGMRNWIKRSAERAVAAGLAEYQPWLKQRKSFWEEKSLRSEIAHQADALRITAERRS